MKRAGLLIAVGLIGCKDRDAKSDVAPPVAVKEIEPAESAKADDGSSDAAMPESMKDARIVPAVEDGAVVGLRFEGVVPGSKTALAGIQSGDVVKAMDGMPMTGAMQGLIFFQGIDAKKPMRLDLVRDGKPVHLEVNK